MLKISNLKKSYGQLQAVKGIDLTVEKGEIVGLLGPNGAGKSTTISMISTLIKPDTGLIEFKEIDVLKDPKPIQKVLGIVPQEIALYPTLTGYENLKFWGHAYGLKGHKLKERIEEVSEIIGIKDRLKDKVEKYSGGMKRRINIGAALLHNPELLIMDEPTVGIDPQSRNHILETIKVLNQNGMSIIYTSHYMEEVEFLCDRIYIMDEGQVIASGTKDSLVSSINGDRKVIVSFAEDPNGIKDVLENNENVERVEVDENQLTVYTKKKENLIKEVVEASSQFDIEMTSIDVENPNLETVFLKLTGKALRD